MKEALDVVKEQNKIIKKIEPYTKLCKYTLSVVKPDTPCQALRSAVSVVEAKAAPSKARAKA